MSDDRSLRPFMWMTIIVVLFVLSLPAVMRRAVAAKSRETWLVRCYAPDGMLLVDEQTKGRPIVDSGDVWWVRAAGGRMRSNASCIAMEIVK